MTFIRVRSNETIGWETPRPNCTCSRGKNSGFFLRMNAIGSTFAYRGRAGAVERTPNERTIDPSESAFASEWVRGKLAKTEFLNTVQGQCAPGILPPTGGTVTFGGETATVPGTNMNQLGTVYATKRRRRNGKRFVTQKPPK